MLSVNLKEPSSAEIGVEAEVHLFFINIPTVYLSICHFLDMCNCNYDVFKNWKCND